MSTVATPPSVQARRDRRFQAECEVRVLLEKLSRALQAARGRVRAKRRTPLQPEGK